MKEDKIKIGIKNGNRARNDVVCFQAEDGMRDATVTGVQTCALPIYPKSRLALRDALDVEGQGRRARGLRVQRGSWSDESIGDRLDPVHASGRRIRKRLRDLFLGLQLLDGGRRGWGYWGRSRGRPGAGQRQMAAWAAGWDREGNLPM